MNCLLAVDRFPKKNQLPKVLPWSGVHYEVKWLIYWNLEKSFDTVEVDQCILLGVLCDKYL